MQIYILKNVNLFLKKNFFFNMLSTFFDFMELIDLANEADVHMLLPHFYKIFLSFLS